MERDLQLSYKNDNREKLLDEISYKIDIVITLLKSDYTRINSWYLTKLCQDYQEVVREEKSKNY